VLNARTGRSQLLGGIVFGIGQALLEAALPDYATGRIANNNISDYLVPVNADINSIEVDTVGTPDPVIDPLGARGMGELPIVGTAAAVANAVFHATGRRIRRLPIRVEDIIV
jgi:xanthine dehydrogenase YagR molybdenum-binding subunit